MNRIVDALSHIRAQLPQQVQLVAVSKFHTVSAIEEAYACGQRVFGESRVQELQEKQPVLPSDIEWHFIGHLQTNKVKYIAPYVSMIQAVDSLRLLQEIDKQAKLVDRTIRCLLEIHVAQESTKYGLSIADCHSLLQSKEWKECTHVKICGVMGMATYTDDTAQIKGEFRQLHTYFTELKAQYFPHDTAFKEISMGMSDDFTLAVEEGSTMVRIGSSIFGNRN